MSKTDTFFTLKIENFFKIKNTEISLSNLTVFIGENNLNKTWLAYLLLTLLTDKHIDTLFRTFYNDRRYKLFRLLEEIFRVLNHTGNNTYIKQLLNSFYEALVKRYCLRLNESFADLIKINTQEVNINCRIKNWERVNIENVKNDLLQNFSNIPIKNLKPKIVKYFLLRKLFKYLTKEFLKQNLAENFFYLPAERNALIQFANLIAYGELSLYRSEEDLATLISGFFPEIFREYKGADESENVESILGERVKRETNYPFFIKKFIDFIFHIKDEVDIEKPINKELLKLFENVNLGGKIYLDEIGSLFYKERLESEKSNTDIPIKIASSMVKSLSGLDLFIKYKFIPNQYLLVIDEPELTLHPEAQVKLMEFIAILINKGLKIILTTHSPYIVDHLVNLMEGYKKIKDSLTESKLEKLFWLPKVIKILDLKEIKPYDILLDPSKVSVYWFQKVENSKVRLQNIKEDTFIDWQTFSRISEKLSDIYYNL